MTTGENLATNIRRELDARGWTQAELARRCGWPQPRVAEILNCRYSPRIATVDVVANAFGLPTSALLLPPAENLSPTA